MAQCWWKDLSIGESCRYSLNVAQGASDSRNSNNSLPLCASQWQWITFIYYKLVKYPTTKLSVIAIIGWVNSSNKAFQQQKQDFYWRLWWLLQQYLHFFNCPRYKIFHILCFDYYGFRNWTSHKNDNNKNWSTQFYWGTSSITCLSIPLLSSKLL